MTDTQRNIKELKAALPRMREKVIAVAVLLALSVTMMASISYAWYTLSFAPEAGKISTQISSNGSLEVALAGLYDKNDNLIEPLASMIGDSFSAKGQSATDANLTWGNLINLSEYYGIEHLVLRPATLDLVGSPSFLSSKHYGEDGRVEGAATDFGFTQYGVKDALLGVKDFLYKSNKYHGVRAISSLIYPEGKGELETKLSLLDTRYAEVVAEYNRICSGKNKDNPNIDYIKTIQSIVQTYLTAKVDAAFSDNAQVSDVVCTSFVDELHVMFYDFYDNAVLGYGDVLAQMASIQTGTVYTRDTLDQINTEQVILSGLATYQSLKSEMDEAKDKMDAAYNKKNVDKKDVLWSDLEGVIDLLIKINTAEITMAGQTHTVNGWMGNKTFLIKNISSISGADVPVLIHDGAFWRFERLTGASMFVQFKLKVTVGLSITFNAQLATDADDAGQPYYAIDKVNTQNKGGTIGPSNKVAADTYGMVLDLWVRTNAADSILTLDGLAKYTETKVPRYIQVVVYAEDGKTTTESRQVFFYNTFKVEEVEGAPIQIKEEHLVYPDTDFDDINNNDDTTDTIYRDVTSRAVVYISETNADGKEVSRLLTAEDVQPKYDIEISVDGFESSNRVDGNYNTVLKEDEISTTQGTGSCYIFYSNNPEEASNIMKMLSFLRLAFVDANNKWLADARLNTEYAYEDNGKYIVPIVITDSDCTYEGKDGADKKTTFYGITELHKNEATLISVIIYLEGAGIENSMVLSSETVTGTLNIQFASTEELEAMFNTDLSNQYLSMSALINGKLSESFTYDGKAHKVNLTADITGIDANSSVQAIFRRKINATQGSVMDPVKLKYDKDSGQWVGIASFSKPGDYVLSGLWIDGVEYDFPAVEGHKTELTVTVDGFALQNVKMYGSPTAFTANSYVTRDVSVSFNASKELQPTTVSARFVSEETGEYITAPMSWNGTQWRGTATFRNSGTYTLQFLVLDGEYYELENEEHRHSLIAYLGLYTEVSLEYPIVESQSGVAAVDESEVSKIYTDLDLSFVYERPTRVGVRVNVYSNDGQKMSDIDQPWLYYYDQRYPGLPEMGLGAELSWNSELQCYYGVFPVNSASYYYFANVKVGNDEYIEKATQAPSISAAYPDPPAYDSSDTPVLTITGNNYNSDANTTTYPVAYYQAKLKYASMGSANIVAVFENAAGERVRKTALGTVDTGMNDTEYTVFRFEFPWVESVVAGEAATQNGTWKVVAFEFYNVYDDAGVFHPALSTEGAKPYVVSLTQEQLKEYTVVNVISAKPTGATLGLDGNGAVVGTFMQAYTWDKLSAITITPGAANGVLPYAGITEMTLTLKHKGDTDAKGGYTVSQPAEDQTGAIATLNGYQTLTFTLRDTDGDGVFTVVSGDPVYLAGTYNYTLVVHTAGNTYTFAGTDVLTVWSKEPTVKISSVSPYKETKRYYLSATPSSLNEVVSGDYNWISTDRLSATVYVYFNLDDSGRDGQILVPNAPKVSLELSGVPSGVSSGTMTFQSIEAKFTGLNGNVTVGGGTSGAYGGLGLGTIIDRYPTINAVGEQTSKQIKIVYNGLSYTATLSDTVTINQPYYPPYADFTISDNRYSGAVPGRVYSANGETIVLPDIENWTNYNVATALTSKNYPTPTTSSAGTYYYDRGWWKYYTYTRTKHTQSCTVESQIDNITYKLQWNVGGKLYEPGTEIAISDAVSITAEIIEVSREFVRTDSVTYTKTWYTYVQSGTSKSGTKIKFTPDASTKYDANNNVYDESETVS